jgi:glycogen operon protein
LHRFTQLLIARRLMRGTEAERRRMNLSQLLQEAKHAWHGVKCDQPDWSPGSHSLAFYAELPVQELRLHLILNAHWQQLDFELPPVSEGDSWRRWIDTALDPPREINEWRAAPPVPGRIYQAGPRSVVVLISGAGMNTVTE